MNNQFDTLEAAQAEILRLQEENTRLENERNTLSENNKTQANELERVRTLNQQYFNKLTMQYTEPDDKNNEEKAPTCEEFAKNLVI